MRADVNVAIRQALLSGGRFLLTSDARRSHDQLSFSCAWAYICGTICGNQVEVHTMEIVSGRDAIVDNCYRQVGKQASGHIVVLDMRD